MRSASWVKRIFPWNELAHEPASAWGTARRVRAGIGWWPKPGEGAPGAWPLPEMHTVLPEPAPVYRAAVDRFIRLGDEAVARLARNQNPRKETTP